MISVIIFSAVLLDSASVPESAISDCFINKRWLRTSNATAFTSSVVTLSLPLIIAA